MEASRGVKPVSGEEIYAALHSQPGMLIRHFNRLYITRREDREDILQSTLLEAFQTRKTYRGDGPLAAWVYGIFRHMTYRHLSRVCSADEKNTVSVGDWAAVPVVSRNPSPCEVLIERERVESVSRAAEQLSAPQRQAVTAILADEWQQVARLKNDRMHAVEKLRRILAA